MRPLSPPATAHATAPQQLPVWLLSLYSGEWLWRGATRAVLLGGDLFAPLLSRNLTWRESLDPAPLPGGLVQARASVEVLDPELRAALDTTPPLGLNVELRLAWLPPEAAASALLAGDNSPVPSLALDDSLLLLHGAVSHWSLTPLGIRLQLIDSLAALAPRPIGRLLRAEMLPGGASPSLGEPLPWVVGRHESLQLVPLEQGLTTHLAQALEPEVRLIFVDDLAGFPATGRVQLGPELIEFTRLDLQHTTIGFGGYGVTRTMPWLRHARGAPIKLIPPGGFTWLVADHPCRAVEAVQADARRLASAQWTTAPRALGAHAAQLITLPLWPVDEDGDFARTLTATVQGQAAADGSLLTNPADVLAWLLTAPRLLGGRLGGRQGALSASSLDASTFAAMRTRLAVLGYEYHRRLSGNETLGELLTGAAREFGAWLTPGTPLRLIPWEPTPQSADAQCVLDAATRLAPDPAALPAAALAPVTGGLPPSAIELLGPPRHDGLGRPAFQFPADTISSGVIPRRIATEWLALSGAAAADLGELAFAHAGDTPFTTRLAYPPGLARLHAGETVRIEEPTLGLLSTLAWVHAAEFDLARDPWLSLTLSGPWVNEIPWQAGGDDQLRRYAFGGKLDVVLNGRPVARLTREGTLRLRGHLRERATLPAALPGDVLSPPAPCTLTAAGLYLSLPTGTAWQPWALFDPAGNLHLAGTLAENTSIPLAPANPILGADATHFWLAATPTHPTLVWSATTAQLALATRLSEAIRL
jgi:hypothetical protein